MSLVYGMILSILGTTALSASLGEMASMSVVSNRSTKY